MIKKTKLILSSIVFFLMLVGVGATYFLTQQNQDIRQQASGGVYTCDSGETCTAHCASLGWVATGVSCGENKVCCAPPDNPSPTTQASPSFVPSPTPVVSPSPAPSPTPLGSGGTLPLPTPFDSGMPQSTPFPTPSPTPLGSGGASIPPAPSPPTIAYVLCGTGETCVSASACNTVGGSAGGNCAQGRVCCDPNPTNPNEPAPTPTPYTYPQGSGSTVIDESPIPTPTPYIYPQGSGSTVIVVATPIEDTQIPPNSTNYVSNSICIQTCDGDCGGPGGKYCIKDEKEIYNSVMVPDHTEQGQQALADAEALQAQKAAEIAYFEEMYGVGVTTGAETVAQNLFFNVINESYRLISQFNNSDLATTIRNDAFVINEAIASDDLGGNYWVNRGIATYGALDILTQAMTFGTAGLDDVRIGAMNWAQSYSEINQENPNASYLERAINLEGVNASVSVGSQAVNMLAATTMPFIGASGNISGFVSSELGTGLLPSAIIPTGFTIFNNRQVLADSFQNTIETLVEGDVYYVPQLNLEVQEINGQLFNNETGELLGPIENFSNYSKLDGVSVMDGGSLSLEVPDFVTTFAQNIMPQKISVNQDFFTSQEWTELTTDINSQTIDSTNIQQITQAFNSNLNYYEPIGQVYLEAYEEERDVNKFDMKLASLSYTYKNSSMESILEKEQTICFDFATAQHLYLEMQNISSNVAASTQLEHAFVVYEADDGELWVADPTWNVVMPLVEHQDWLEYDDLTIKPSLFEPLGD